MDINKHINNKENSHFYLYLIFIKQNSFNTYCIFKKRIINFKHHNNYFNRKNN